MEKQFFDFSFWQQFVSNGLATLIGAIIGIPSALGVARYLERLSEQEHKKKILEVLFSELITNFTVLSGWQKSGNKSSESLALSTTLRNESWKAFSDGGELEWIRDINILDSLAEAYFSIRSVMSISGDYFSVVYCSPTVYHEAEVMILERLEKSVTYSIEVISQTLEIAKKLDAKKRNIVYRFLSKLRGRKK
jgi:hypothetical protein